MSPAGTGLLIHGALDAPFLRSVVAEKGMNMRFDGNQVRLS